MIHKCEHKINLINNNKIDAIMENVNLNLDFTKTGTPFIRTYQAVVINPHTKERENLLIFSNEESALNEAKMFENMGYTFLYINRGIVFLR